MTKSHPLASRPAVAMPSLAEEPFVLLPRHRNRVVHDRIVDCCRAAGFYPNVAEEAFPVSSVMLLVSAGLGISVVPAFVSMVLCQRDLTFRPFEDPSPSVGLSVAWRAREPSPTLQLFVDLVPQDEGTAGT